MTMEHTLVNNIGDISQTWSPQSAEGHDIKAELLALLPKLQYRAELMRWGRENAAIFDKGRLLIEEKEDGREYLVGVAVIGPTHPRIDEINKYVRFDAFRYGLNEGNTPCHCGNISGQLNTAAIQVAQNDMMRFFTQACFATSAPLCSGLGMKYSGQGDAMIRLSCPAVQGRRVLYET